MGVRFELGTFQEPSTRLGRKYCKLKDGEEVIGVCHVTAPLKKTVVAVVSAQRTSLALSGRGGCAIGRTRPWSDRPEVRRRMIRWSDLLYYPPKRRNWCLIKEDGGSIVRLPSQIPGGRTRRKRASVVQAWSSDRHDSSGIDRSDLPIRSRALAFWCTI